MVYCANTRQFEVPHRANSRTARVSFLRRFEVGMRHGHSIDRLRPRSPLRDARCSALHPSCMDDRPCQRLTEIGRQVGSDAPQSLLVTRSPILSQRVASQANARLPSTRRMRWQ